MAVQRTERCVSGIFNDWSTSSSCHDGRHIRKLSEQVYGHNGGKTAARILQTLRINRQVPRVNVYKDRLMARRDDGPDERRICKQGQRDARRGLQPKRTQKKVKRLPAAASPHPWFSTEERNRLGGRAAGADRL
jgi:hypothetical protein